MYKSKVNKNLVGPAARANNQKIGKIFMKMRTKDFFESMKAWMIELGLDEDDEDDGLNNMVIRAEQALEERIEEYGEMRLKEVLYLISKDIVPKEVKKSVIEAVYIVPVSLLHIEYHKDEGEDYEKR